MNNKTETFYDAIPTEEQVQSLIASFDRQDEEARKNTEYRMENYYNCVDDYSWGGRCDQAQNEARGYRNSARTQLMNQLENGVFTEDFEVNVLTDLEGNIVSERLVDGRFGQCWLIKKENGAVEFVGVAKKPATYEKKGYKVMTKVFKVEYYYTTKFIDFKGLVVKARLLGEELKDAFAEYPTTTMERELYFAVQNS